MTENDLLQQCISSLWNDLVETKREIESLQREVETYEKVIKKLKELQK